MDECPGEKKRNGGYNIHVVVIWKNKDFYIYILKIKEYKGNNKITELQTILQRESPNS